MKNKAAISTRLLADNSQIDKYQYKLFVCLLGLFVCCSSFSQKVIGGYGIILNAIHNIFCNPL